jgi:type II secretory pathway pseudopilin PulG
MNRLRDRRAFTLVELLVVASIMVLFFGLVAAGSKPGSSGQVRQAAQQLASVLTAAQSRGLGNAAGAAIIFDSGTVSDLAATVSITAFNADVPPFIAGTATIAGLPLPASAMAASITLVPLNADAEDLQNAYKLQLGGAVTIGTIPYQPPSQWLNFSFGSATAQTATGMIAFRITSGQTALNSIWPEPTRSTSGTYNPFAFCAARYPVKGDTAFDIPKAAAVDLRYSGIGEDNATIWNQTTWIASGTAVSGWGTLAGKGAIAIAVDRVGGVDGLMQDVFSQRGLRAAQPPIDPIEPIYLLVNSRAAIDDPTVPPLSSQEAMWVVIHPQNGRVSVATNVPQTGFDADALRAARARARAGTIGVK